MKPTISQVDRVCQACFSARWGLAAASLPGCLARSDHRLEVTAAGPGPSSAAVIRYDAICQAIAAVVEVDEVKPIRDQILVLQLYAEQARIIRIVLGGSLVNAAADGEGEGGRK